MIQHKECDVSLEKVDFASLWKFGAIHNLKKNAKIWFEELSIELMEPSVDSYSLLVELIS